jgi:hypothetical protein
MVRRMVLRALAIAPIVIVALWIAGGTEYALSAAIGIGLTILNLWLSARLIGAVADRNPQLLMPVAMATFMLGLLVLTGIALLLRNIDAVYFPVTGFVLIGSHLLVVIWEAGVAYDKVQKPESNSGTAMKVRS